MTTVVALGGNALVARGERGTVAEQRANLRRHVGALAPLLDGPLVLTHGNGPQVGADLVRSERAADEVPPLPLWVAVAQTQAEIGSLIAQEVRAAGRDAACVVTHVRVDRSDPAFADPTKPIGPFYPSGRARTLERERGWRLVEEPGRGWRRVVPSPLPLDVLELEQVRTLLTAGVVAIACGGGGIPVVGRDGNVEGVDAVIDKDLASSLLGQALGATRLVILTEVEAVFNDFGSDRERPLRSLAAADAQQLLPNLPPGSMRPKVQAAADFARATGGTAVITSADALGRALRGEAGTSISA